MSSHMEGLSSEGLNKQADRTGEVTAISRLGNEYLMGRFRRHEIGQTTLKKYRCVLFFFCRTYGNRQVRMMGRTDVERWMDTRTHLSTGALRSETVIVRGFLAWLRENRHLKADPMLTIKNGKAPRAVPRALSDEDVARLWAVLPDARARALVALQLGMGLRLSESINADLSEWDRSAGLLRVLGKGNKSRIVPIPQWVADVLDTYLTGRRGTGTIIVRDDGHTKVSLSWVDRNMREWMFAAGVKKAIGDGRSSHALRHTLASRVVDREPDLRVVQQILGHEHLSSTAIYLRFAEMSKLRAAMERPTGNDESPIGQPPRPRRHIHARRPAFQRTPTPA